MTNIRSLSIAELNVFIRAGAHVRTTLVELARRDEEILAADKLAQPSPSALDA